MNRLVLVLLVATAVNAGNLAIGLNSGGYDNYYGRVLGTGSTVSQQSSSTSIANSASSPVAIASAPTVAVAASPLSVLSIPTASSSQSRVDIINSSPLVSQVVSSVPVNVALSGVVGNGYGYGYGNGLVASAGLVTGSVNSAYGTYGHGLRSY